MGAATCDRVGIGKIVGIDVVTLGTYVIADPYLLGTGHLPVIASRTAESRVGPYIRWRSGSERLVLERWDQGFPTLVFRHSAVVISFIRSLSLGWVVRVFAVDQQ